MQSYKIIHESLQKDCDVLSGKLIGNGVLVAQKCQTFDFFILLRRALFIPEHDNILHKIHKNINQNKNKFLLKESLVF